MQEFIRLYNDKNFKQIYATTAPAFQAKVPEQPIVGILNAVYVATGKASSFTFTGEKNDVYNYFLIAEKGKTSVSFALDTNSKATVLNFKPAPENINSAPFTHTSKGITLNNLIEKWQADTLNAGLVLGIIEGDQAKLNYFGKIDHHSRRKPAMDDQFEIGSIAKVFTGIITHQLIQEGKLSLEDSVNHFLSNDLRLPTLNKKPILIRHLVTHYAGLPVMPTNFKHSVKNPKDPNKDYTEEWLKAYIDSIEILRAPGKTFEYSNLGTALLGYVLTRITGHTYERLLKQYVTKPLKMTNTTCRITGKLISGHDHKGVGSGNWQFSPILQPAGGIYSSPSDMLKFLQVCLNPQNYKIGKVIFQATSPIAENKADSIGTFWIRTNKNGVTRCWHNGATGGFNAFIGFIEGEAKGVFVLSNNQGNISTTIGMAALDSLLKI